MLFTEGTIDALAPHGKGSLSQEINPHVDEWEAAGKALPVHEISPKPATRPASHMPNPKPMAAWAGLRYSISAAEEFGTIHCGGYPWAIGVATDHGHPALDAIWARTRLREEFLRPAISGE